MTLAYLPSPSQGIWHLGPIPIRAYALCIVAGIVAAIWIGERRWVARGGRRGTVSDVAVWAVVFGLVGGRLYHVLTDAELYFGAGRNPVDAFKIWEGGLGIWGAISLGGVGAWIGCRRRGIRLPPYADAVVPGVAVAQGIGRFGNWFNQELFGRPTTLPWGLEIDPGRPNTVAGAEAYHPTFLYEALWDFGLAGLLIWVDHRFRLGRGRVLALYVMGYCAGRVWIEALRIDDANTILGVRLNIWTSIVVFAGGLLYFLRHPGPRETVVEPGAAPAPESAEYAESAGAESAGAGAADPESAGAGAAGGSVDGDATAAADAPADADTPSAEQADDAAEPAADGVAGAAPEGDAPAHGDAPADRDAPAHGDVPEHGDAMADRDATGARSDREPASTGPHNPTGVRSGRVDDS